MRKGDIEKSLKRFLKRKVSYSLSLLIAFMITGGISLGAGITAEEIQETKGDLLTKIQAEREEIKRKIAENERMIKEYNSDFVELVRKGDFYSKPLFNSTQVFLSYQYLDNGKMKDRTDKEFSETIDAINKHYGTKSGRSLLRATGNIGKDKIMSGNGVAVDTEVFRETIEVGANIKPIHPSLPLVNPSVSVNVSAPTVNLGALPGTVSPTIVGVPTISAPSISAPSAPTGVSVSVSTPSAVAAISVTAPTITTPTAPSDKTITVLAPIAPDGYTPSVIPVPGKPIAPPTPTILLFTPYDIVFNGTGFGQPSGKSTPKSNIIMQNYEKFISSGITITTGSAGTSWTGNITTESGGSSNLTTGSTGSILNAFISHVDNLNAEVTGNYDFTGTTGGNNSKLFISLNPYYVQGTDKTFDFQGTLVMHGNGPGTSEALVGMEHQILTYVQGGTSTGTSIMKNSGTIELNSGKNMIGIQIDTEYDNASPEFLKQPQTINAGLIKISSGASQSIGIDFGLYYFQNASVSGPNNKTWLGNIEVNGTNNYGFRMKDYYGVPNPSTGVSTTIYYDKIQVTGERGTAGNYGTITLGGNKNIGISVAQGHSTGDPIQNLSNLSVVVGGTENVGFYRNPNYSGTNHNAMIMNSTRIHDFKFAAGATNSTLFRSDLDEIILAKNLTLTAGSTGNSIMQAGGVGKVTNQAVVTSSLPTFYGLTAGDFNSSTGATASNTGTITLTGNNSIGMAIATGNTGNNSGTINFTGTGGSGIYNRGIFNLTNGSKINVEGTTSSGIYNLKPVVGVNTVSISGTVGIDVKKGATAIYSNGGTIASTSGNALTISVDDTSNPATRGLAVYAEGGAAVNLGAANIDVKNGAAGVAAFGAGTSINLTGAELKYSGEGYAAYSDGNGTINLTNANLELSGKATGVELDLLAPKVTMNNTTITMMSNDATVANLKNATGLLTSNLKSTVETNLGSGVSIANGFDGINTFDKYKIATVDGGDLTIDDDMSKYNQNETTTGYFYSRRFLGQRLNLTVDMGVKVLSLTDTAYATAYFNNQIVGLEMSSSKAATSATDAQINLLANSEVSVDRVDAGNGAIGLYMNFGKVDIAGGARVEVGKIYGGSNKAVGVYAVNGSTVLNNGSIEVGGDQSIGILGMAYREQPIGTPLVNEFGTGGIFTAQGKADITNSSKITLDGKGSIGIYAYNNNTLGTEADVTVTNTAIGEIKVGSSDASNAAIGIYGDKATISNQGKVSVGDGGVAIYAKNKTKVASLGILDLGADGVGVMLDGTSDLNAATVTVTSNNTGTLGKTAIYYKGTGGETKNISVAVNASALDKGTAIYAEDMSVSSSGALSIGTSGVGIYIKGTASNTGTNKNVITLGAGKTGAVGMYTKTANILNDTTTGIINVNDASQIGMYAEGSGVKAINQGTINLKVDGTTGIYVKAGAVTELNTGNKIVFDGKSSVGVFAENSSVNFKDNQTLTSTNENKNIFVYGKDTTVGIDSGKTVIIDGVGTPTTPGNKTVGVYLENVSTGSTFNGTGKLNVTNEAVGIYSKGNNTLNVDVTAAGDKTTGIFIDGTSTISGTVAATGTATAGAVGVYGSGGAVTIDTGGLVLNTNSGRGTGMYLTDGASATGGTITVNNTVAGTKNIGVYYSKGTASGTVTNGSVISIANNESIGIYAADGITLVNNSNITSVAGKSENIGSYVGGGSQLTSTGTITMNDDDSIGIYVEEGRGINSGAIAMNGTASSLSKSVVGMAAETQTGKTAVAENAAGGTITAGANLGMYVGGTGTSSGKNAGTITTTTGTGVYVDGSTNSFDGTGGTINSNAVGMYLKNTGVNKITAGTFNIASGGVGVFGENANIDFAVNVSGVEAVGVAAKTNSVISGNITTTGQDSVGVYVLDNTVTFNGANITTGTKSGLPSKSSIGILLESALGTYTMSNVTVNAQDGVGIYLDGTTPGTNLTHSGTINTVGGIGIYVDNGTTLTTNTTVLNINGGTGVYVDGGTANLGTIGSLTFNFLAGGGIGVFNNGGTMNLGANINVTGSGSLAATTNGSLSSSGTLNIGEGATGLMGLYDSGLAAAHSVNNSGTITAVSGGIGLAAVKGGTNPGFPVTINNTGTINASGKSSTNTPSIGIYTDVADVANTGNINVGSNGIGIYSAHNGVLTSVQNNNMNMTGTDGIGVYIKGATNGLTANNINSTSSRNTGVVLEGTAGNINVGTVNLGNESVGVFATGTAVSTIDGTISTGEGSASKSAIGIVAQNGADMTMAGTATITTEDKGIGVYAEGASTTATVSNAGNISVGATGIYMYSKGATLNFSGNITANNQTGIVAEGGTINVMGASTITVQNGGVGAYVKGAAPSFGTTTIDVQTGTSSIYSMGVYYDGVSSIGTAPVITQSGSYTLGMALNNSTGTTAGGISIGGAGTSNQVGVMAKGNSNLTVAGTVNISGGDNNIGIYGENSIITVNGNVAVGNSSLCINKASSSIGVVLSGGSYTGSGNLSAGNYSIGVFGKRMVPGSVITQGTGTETMTVGTEGVGIYGEGTGGTITANMSNITVGTGNAIGVYAKEMDSVVTGNMGIGANTSVGIASEGTGNITYTGAITIDDKGTGKDDTASVGIYKKLGSGTITTSGGNWSVGNSGYGIYVQQAIVTVDAAGKEISTTMTSNSATINNSADMNLGMSSVGIFSNGDNTVNNSGNITVGETYVEGGPSNHSDPTKHLNSVGIYGAGGTKIFNAAGATIKVHEDHSVGVYVDGSNIITGDKTRFENYGIIDVDNGGVGVIVRNGAIAVNEGVITLGGNASPICGAVNVGMSASGPGSTIENNGTITINSGAGMVVGNQANLINTGTLNVNNGVGITGTGHITNTGTMNVAPGATGEDSSGLATAEVGVVTIKPDGTILINDQYTAIGGTLSTAGDIIVDGAYVDATTGTPLFNAHSVSGEVRLLPNFASTGNGISYEMEGFVNTALGTITGTKLTPVTSPLFIAKITDKGSLVIAKRPYADLTIGEQFDAMDKGLDNILKNSGGSGRDADILKGLNEYLEGLPADQFERETSLKLAEFRGDIYATIQGRMQDINQAFNNSFYELESSYNLTKDSSKYSVIYTDGNYKDSTLGIDDYDYKVMGLLYMKEKEGTEYGSKYGYTIGFAGSKFDFDDGGSKEDVYSLRVGAHRVKNLSDEHKVSWLSRIELGYNRHIAKRKLNLQETFENKGEYNTYSVALDNRLTKVIYTDLSRQLDVYADLDLEYGKVDDFKERAGSKGGLEVQIKDNDYLSAQAAAGVKASQRIYAGNDISVKVTADVKYAYEFGDNYDGNKARLKNGEEGYYSLITPEEREGKLSGKVGLTVEKANHMGVTFEVEAADESHKKDSSIKYGVRFNYKF
ncbi:autotransporter-associated N-terminal domain-containing protein [Fusobacterium varium]